MCPQFQEKRPAWQSSQSKNPLGVFCSSQITVGFSSSVVLHPFPPSPWGLRSSSSDGRADCAELGRRGERRIRSGVWRSDRCLHSQDPDVDVMANFVQKTQSTDQTGGAMECTSVDVLGVCLLRFFHVQGDVDQSVDQCDGPQCRFARSGEGFAPETWEEIECEGSMI